MYSYPHFTSLLGRYVFFWGGVRNFKFYSKVTNILQFDPDKFHTVYIKQECYKYAIYNQNNIMFLSTRQTFYWKVLH